MPALLLWARRFRLASGLTGHKKGWLVPLIAAIVFSLWAAEFRLTQTNFDFAQANSPTSRKYLPETMGGGVALPRLR